MTKENPFLHKETPKRSLQEQIADLINKKHPEWLKTTDSQQAEIRSDARVIEDFLDDQELSEAISRLGMDISELEQLPDGNFSLDVKSHFSERRLPVGYAYKGGAARSLLLRSLGVDPESMPRDMDIVRIADTEPFDGADDLVSREFMPDDYEHGNGVERLVDLQEYLESRDLTINEILATDKKITASRECILDNLRGILRMTDFEKGRYQGDDSKMLSKILRFYSEAILKKGEAFMPDYGHWDFGQVFLSPFWIALNVEKASQRGQIYLDAFIETLKKHQQIPQDLNSAEEVTAYLNQTMLDRPFYFRYAPVRQFEIEGELAARERMERRVVSRDKKIQQQAKW